MGNDMVSAPATIQNQRDHGPEAEDVVPVEVARLAGRPRRNRRHTPDTHPCPFLRQPQVDSAGDNEQEAKIGVARNPAYRALRPAWRASGASPLVARKVPAPFAPAAALLLSTDSGYGDSRPNAAGADGSERTDDGRRQSVPFSRFFARTIFYRQTRCRGRRGDRTGPRSTDSSI